MRVALLLPFVLLSGCISTPPHEHLARPEPIFSPDAFFSGRTEGKATLHIILKGAQPVRVEGEGHVAPDGTLVLVQRVRRGEKAPAIRTWRLHEAGPRRYTGTLTGAKGPVTGDVAGNRLHLRFTSKDGTDTEQWLYLQPGGQEALNRMVVRKFGIPVASLTETIRKQ